jgi:hypothetical protein
MWRMIGLVCLLALGWSTTAQDGSGEYITGSYNGETTQHTLNAAAGELLVVQIIGTAETFTLSLDDDNRMEQVVIYAAQDSEYTLNVAAASSGDYILRVDRYTATDVTGDLLQNQTTQFLIDADETYTMTFSGNAQLNTPFTVEQSTTEPFAFHALLSDATTGQVINVARFTPSLRSNNALLRAGDYRLTIIPQGEGGSFLTRYGIQVDSTTSPGFVPLPPDVIEEPLPFCFAEGGTTGARIYAAPEPDAEVLGSIPPEGSFPVTGRIGLDWYAINFNGQRGWITTLETTVGGSDCMRSVPQIERP